MRALRPDLQGLRAVAVLLVLGYHLWPQRLTGGFVGVDVFFVLSGFLITGHLVAEAERTGRIGLREFWARRIRRLLPAASIVLAASFLLMLALVPQSLWQRSVVEIGASALYAQNWVLLGASVDYLGAENTPTLVQHFWSLSVEEQFYLVWPLLVVLAIALRPGRRSVAAVLALVFAGSLAYSVTAGESSYFDTAARAWEFAAGGLLALLPARPLPRPVGFVLGWLGIALVVWSALAFSGQTPFPGWAALVPVFGTVFAIHAGGAGGRFGAGRLASSRPLVAVGDHSYGIYLWHWPLVVVTPFLIGGPLSLPAKLGVVVVTLVLAIATRRVEQRVRVAPMLARPRRVYGLAAASLAVLLVTTGATWGALGAGTAAAADRAVADFETLPCYGAEALADDSCAAPFAAPDGMASAFAAVDKGPLGLPCDSVTADWCEFGDLSDPERSVVVIGNSHAGHLVAGLEQYGLDHGWKITLMRKTGCTGVSTAAQTAETHPDCVAWSQRVLDEVRTDAGVDAVVIATNNDAAQYLVSGGADTATVEAVRANVSANLASLVAAGKAVLAVGDVPRLDSPAPECVDLHRRDYDPCSVPRARGEEHGNIVAEASRLTPGVGFESLLPYLCDSARCHVVIGGVVVYIDEHHLSASYSRSLGPYLGAAVAAQIARTG
jgi:peptidoglycan/LPS O-acetylase OafA/YrhL